MSFQKFRDQFLENTLNLLWGQWAAFGVHGRSGLPGDFCIDPEALLLTTAHFGRFDQRLFDGALEWFLDNENIISVQRMNALMKKERFEGAPIVRVMAAFLLSQMNRPKWKKLGGNIGKTGMAGPLFFYPNGEPVESFGNQDPLFEQFGYEKGPFERRGLTGPFLWGYPACLWLRLRAFFGVTARSEICVYLLTHMKGAHPSLIARKTGIAQRSVQEALVSMSASGLVLKQESRREVDYSLANSLFDAFAGSLDGEPLWMNWSAFYRGLESLWQKLSDSRLISASADVQSAELHETMAAVIAGLKDSTIAYVFREGGQKKGKNYVDFLRDCWDRIFKFIRGEIPPTSL
jgi:hypothetical protein